MSVATEQVYTLADLKNWPPERAHFPANGVALAVIGHPIAHSLSPVMHNAALKALAKTNVKFSDWRYFKFDIAPEDLGESLALFHKNEFRGLNLTVPHKALAVRHVDDINSFARDAGATNTLHHAGSWWKGYNTDGIGLSGALAQDLNTKLKGEHVILLGAGGAARAAALECAQSGCTSLWIANRTSSTLNALLADLQKSSSFNPATRLNGFDPQNPPTDLPENSVVINATSLGLKLDDAAPLDLAQIPRPAKVFEMIYRPATTALLRKASSLGIPNANGLSMLVHQGAASLSIWTGETSPAKVMDDAVRNALDHSP